jgi:hypothetical protein
MNDLTKLALAYGDVLSVARLAAELDCECTDGSDGNEPEACLGCVARTTLRSNADVGELAWGIADAYAEETVKQFELKGGTQP